MVGFRFSKSCEILEETWRAVKSKLGLPDAPTVSFGRTFEEGDEDMQRDDEYTDAGTHLCSAETRYECSRHTRQDLQMRDIQTSPLCKLGHPTLVAMFADHNNQSRVINRFVDCMVQAVHVTCGPEAATWHRELISKLLSSTLNGIECTLAGCSVRASLFIISITFMISRFFTNNP
ncbi:hypothetical protein CAPTEDRAFT_212980 [Capitella teleta]|uniref:Uncharacterized protein n=1 Tax=Capitella teleta TaxID=283909 RepID=R7UHS7_CAPTE|nr:hypothetical protein CAPTEDRAFT_212980 [Capitella teleta]|eukprot:ELU02832.1 hypothetical protein CAPTEDRAFT_212980 [Capitella teleta]